MDVETVQRLCLQCFAAKPESIDRCGVGQGNFVYITTLKNMKVVIRCSQNKGAYDETVYWLKRLSSTGVSVPNIIKQGSFETYDYLILSYLEGKDLGLVYAHLNDDEKKTIAKEIVEIQNRVGKLKLSNIEDKWTWYSFLDEMLERASERIAKNGYFDVEKVKRLQGEVWRLKKYFDTILPFAYLDDISTKNLLIKNGKISGIIDVDWIGIGDKLTFVALTNMALLNSGYDTDYVKYILDEMKVSDSEKKAFLFYTLLFCVDFMGERGMQFIDKKIEVSPQIIEQLNSIYDSLWDQWTKLMI